MSAFFSKSINKRSRQSMINFLDGHFRHGIGNDYKTSYAHNVKINNLSLGNLSDKAYDLIQVDETWDELQQTIAEFDETMEYRYTIGSAGRSCGYLVLLETEKTPSGYKSYCLSCGQRNYKSVVDVDTFKQTTQGLIALEVIKNGGCWFANVYLEQDAVKAIDLSESEKLLAIADAKRRYKDYTIDNRCGRCGASGNTGRTNSLHTHMRVDTFPYRSIDAERDFSDWTMDELRNRVRTVQAFDSACDAIRDQFIFMLRSCEVVEETIMVPKVVKHLSCACSA
ncbi:cysteine protease [Acidithiobacillus ferrivorans]|nr:cysteine protease [Acidithiobacillus ferrivorans]